VARIPAPTLIVLPFQQCRGDLGENQDGDHRGGDERGRGGGQDLVVVDADGGDGNDQVDPAD